MLETCLNSFALLGQAGIRTVLLAMFAAGLAGGVTHCAGMCGPFVVAQMVDGAGGPVLRRLGQGLLLPYHAGRALGYALLGAVAGAGAGTATTLLGPGLLAVPLGLAAALMLAQGLQRLGWAMPFPGPRLPSVPLARPLARWLPKGGTPAQRFLMGLLLAALPCGLLHAALAGAAATGGAVPGASAMLAFVLGTMPGLMAAGMLGRFLVRRGGSWLRPAAAGVFLLNAAVLAGLSVSAALP
jgi:sulfite exporter TauE/SafE